MLDNAPQRPPVYSNEVHWRMAMMLNLVALRRTIGWLTLTVAGISFGFASASWWPEGPYVATLAFLGAAAAELWRDYRAFQALHKIYEKTDYNLL